MDEDDDDDVDVPLSYAIFYNTLKQYKSNWIGNRTSNLHINVCTNEYKYQMH